MRMLLAHSSGLPAYARLFEQHTSANGLLRACLQMPLEAAPGTRADYSDIGFILLGKALEVLAGDALADFVSARSLRRLDWPDAFLPAGVDACPDSSD